MTLHPNIIAGAMREAAVLVTSDTGFDIDSKGDCEKYTATFEFLLNCVVTSETLAEAAVEVVVGEFANPLPVHNPTAAQAAVANPDPFPAPVAAPAPQAAPQAPAPQHAQPAPPPQYQQPVYAQPTALPQQAPPPPASISPNSSEDELWASLIAEFQVNGRLVSWEDKRQRKGPNGRGADFAHLQIQKQGKDGKWWPMGLWLNNRTPGWVLPALQQAGLG